MNAGVVVLLQHRHSSNEERPRVPPGQDVEPELTPHIFCLMPKEKEVKRKSRLKERLLESSKDCEDLNKPVSKPHNNNSTQ